MPATPETNARLAEHISELEAKFDEIEKYVNENDLEACVELPNGSTLYCDGVNSPAAKEREEDDYSSSIEGWYSSSDLC